MVSRRKIGTILDEDLLRDAKMAAAREGIPLSTLFEKAIRTYLDRRPINRPAGAVAAGWASIPVDLGLLKQVMEEEDSLLEA